MLSCRSEGHEPPNPVETGVIPDPNLPVEGDRESEETPGPNPPRLAPEKDLEPVTGN